MRKYFKIGRTGLSSLLWPWALIRNNLLPKPQVRILTYHRVGNNSHPLNVLPNHFEKQMRYLSEEYQVICLEDLYYWMIGKLKLPAKAVIITFDDGYDNNFSCAFPILQKHGLSATIFLTTGRLEKKVKQDLMLTWDHIQEMSDYGIQFGVHTIDHSCLTRLSSEEAEKQIRIPKAIIEDRISKRVIFFCYPSGYYNQHIKYLVKMSGYLGACSQIPGANVRSTDHYLLRRTEISRKDVTLFDFKKKLMGAFDPLHRINYRLNVNR